MERWAVQVTETQLQALSPEQAGLGTHLCSNGQHFIVFRDSFVALKFASQLGVQRSLVHALPANSELTAKPLTPFADGNSLVAKAG